MYKVAVIEEIHNDGIKILEDNNQYKFELIKDPSEENLIKKLPEFDACTLRVSKLDEKILKHCPNLKVISRHGVGIDNVDLDYIKNKITLLDYCNSECSFCSRACFINVLAISKSIKIYDKEVREGNFKK